MVAAADDVWIIADGYPRAPLLHVVSATNDVRVVARPQCCDGIGLLAGDDDALWISASDNTMIQRFEVGTERLAPAICCEVTPDALALGEGALWAIERYDEQVVGLDPDTGSIRAAIPFGAPRPPGRNFLGAEVISVAAAGLGAFGWSTRSEASFGRSTQSIRRSSGLSRSDGARGALRSVSVLCGLRMRSPGRFIGSTRCQVASSAASRWLRTWRASR
jgi:hypothetical protein